MSDRENSAEKTNEQTQTPERGSKEKPEGRTSSPRQARDSDRSDSRPSGPRGRGKVYFKKKVCRFCTQNVPLDYKNPDNLWRFLTDRGKILPRRITGTCARHQRELSRHVKRARILALLPFVKH